MASQVFLDGNHVATNGTSQASSNGFHDQTSAHAALDPAPSINVNNVFLRQVDKKVANLEAAAAGQTTDTPSTQNGVQTTVQTAPSLPPTAGVLTLLEGRTFSGKGFNTIFRPRSSTPLSGEATVAGSLEILELNLTAETLSFSQSLGNIPNRGLGAQADIILNGIPYVQRVQALENPLTGLGDAKPTDIHFEPGMFVAIPATTQSPVQNATISRMASIPHGATINAQGPAPNITKPTAGKPSHPTVNITPFNIGDPSSFTQFVGVFQGQTLGAQTDRIPQDLSLFNTKGTITQAILNDPNTVLRNAIKGQDIASFIQLDLTTLPTPFVSGGTTNIAFLGGTGATVTGPGNPANAHATVMSVTFWVETVRARIQAQPQRSGNQHISIRSPAGVTGPTFVVPPTTGRTAVTTIPVTWTQLQYSQTVLLNFNGLSWPHVSVATLGDTSTIPVKLPAA